MAPSVSRNDLPKEATPMFKIPPPGTHVMVVKDRILFGGTVGKAWRKTFQMEMWDGQTLTASPSHETGRWHDNHGRVIHFNEDELMKWRVPISQVPYGSVWMGSRGQISCTIPVREFPEDMRGETEVEIMNLNLPCDTCLWILDGIPREIHNFRFQWEDRKHFKDLILLRSDFILEGGTPDSWYVPCADMPYGTLFIDDFDMPGCKWPEEVCREGLEYSNSPEGPRYSSVSSRAHILLTGLSVERCRKALEFSTCTEFLQHCELLRTYILAVSRS